MKCASVKSLFLKEAKCMVPNLWAGFHDVNSTILTADSEPEGNSPQASGKWLKDIYFGESQFMRLLLKGQHSVSSLVTDTHPSQNSWCVVCYQVSQWHSRWCSSTPISFSGLSLIMAMKAKVLGSLFLFAKLFGLFSHCSFIIYCQKPEE